MNLLTHHRHHGAESRLGRTVERLNPGDVALAQPNRVTAEREHHVARVVRMAETEAMPDLVRQDQQAHIRPTGFDGAPPVVLDSDRERIVWPIGPNRDIDVWRIRTAAIAHSRHISPRTDRRRERRVTRVGDALVVEGLPVERPREQKRQNPIHGAHPITGSQA